MKDIKFERESLIDSTYIWEITNRISNGELRLYDICEDVYRNIARYNAWALTHIPWDDLDKAHKAHNLRRTSESVFFLADNSGFCDLGNEIPDKFNGQVLWLMDQNPDRDKISISGRKFKITTSGIQLLGEGASVTPHIEKPDVTELIFPLWTLNHPTYGIGTDPWLGLASYQVEGVPDPEYLHWQMEINRLVQSTFALRIKEGKFLQLDVYEPDYDAPSREIEPIILPNGKTHEAQSKTQCLYFAMKLELLSTEGG